MKADQATVDWLRRYYDAMDHMRFEEVAAFLHEDCRSQFPNGVEIEGAEKIMRLTEKSLGSLERIRHELKNAWEEDGGLIFELEVTYWRTDGEAIVRPGVGIFVIHDGLIAEQRLFVDYNEVWR